MNVSLNWLKEYVDVPKNMSIKEITELVTMTGSKVENAVEFGKKVTNVVTGKVVELVDNMVDAKAKVLKIDVGNRVLTAVAKIPDIEINDIIPVALEGAQVIGKEVKKGEVLGVVSECMVCHVNDLGLPKELPLCKPSGLITFPQNVELGTDINQVLGLGDYIIEFEITPNRPDCLSAHGIAKELAASLNLPCKGLKREIKIVEEVKKEIEGINVTIDTKNCNRYMLKVAKDIKIKESPIDMQVKLIKSGIRPINNIVDITNFVMIEMGQPLHAFDKNHVKGNKIIVRQAENNEQIETLDGVKRELNSDVMVIANETHAMAMAGIMGGELSGIASTTTEIVIESASFVRGNIRNTSKRQSIRTDASSRYEKGLSPELTDYAMSRVCELIEENDYGVVVDGIVDEYKNVQKETRLNIDYDYINRYLGITLSNSEIDKILESVDIKTENGVAVVPYFRQDIEIREDLCEEVARLYGYNKIPSKLPEGAVTFGAKTGSQKSEDMILNIVTSCGYSEIYTYTFFGESMLDRMCVPKDSSLRNLIKITNPLSQEFEYMRTTLMPHMLETLERNYNKKNLNVKLFELGKVFNGVDKVKKGEIADETQILSIGVYGKNESYYTLKSVIECLLKAFNISEDRIEFERCIDTVQYHPGQSAYVLVDGKRIGVFGKLSPVANRNYRIHENTYIAEIYTDVLKENYGAKVKFVELPKYPTVERDVAIMTKQEILSGDMVKAIKAVNNQVDKVELFDVYQGEQIEKGYKSMAYRVYLRSNEKTLEETEITGIMNKIIAVLEEKFEARIRE